MSRVATRSSAASRDEEVLELAATALRGEGLLKNLTSLVAEARSAKDTDRPGRVGAINALLARLPTEAEPAAASEVLQRLLSQGDVEGLADEERLPVRIAATRALMELGYPHALEVAPEHLDAMRRWKPRPPPVPWVFMSAALFLGFIAQIFCVSQGTHFHPFPMVDALALQGLPPPEPTGLEVFRKFLWRTSDLVMGGQLLANFGAFIVAVSVGWLSTGHWLARRLFLGIGAVGVLASAVQLVANPWLAATTLVSALSSFLVVGLMAKR